MSNVKLHKHETVDDERVELVQTFNETSPCPECADEGPHDDNGATRLSDLSFCCSACGSHFDACQA